MTTTEGHHIRIPNAELREAMVDVLLQRNLYGPFATTEDAVLSMLKDNDSDIQNKK